MIPYPCWLPLASAVRIMKVASCIARIAIQTLYTVERAIASPPSRPAPAPARPAARALASQVGRILAAQQQSWTKLQPRLSREVLPGTGHGWYMVIPGREPAEAGAVPVLSIGL